MFSKNSRYRKLPEIVATDSKGRALPSMSLRLLPEVSGTFLHTVAEVDRLDGLAYKYYKQPGKWWRICDANPEFLSPQALLGKEPIVTVRFPLTLEDEESQPPWTQLMQQLSQVVGVEDFQIAEARRLVAEVQTIDDKSVTVYVTHYERAVVVRYNQMNVNAEALARVMADVGFKVGTPENIGRVGKPMVIPPEVVG